MPYLPIAKAWDDIFSIIQVAIFVLYGWLRLELLLTYSTPSGAATMLSEMMRFVEQKFGDLGDTRWKLCSIHRYIANRVDKMFDERVF